MIREEMIEKKLADMIDAVNMIKENFPKTFSEFEPLGLVKHGLYKQLEYAIESVLDICSIVNSDLNLGFPETEDNILEHLEKSRIFSSKFIKIVREMKKFRNYLVHKYGDVDDRKAYKDIKAGLGDFVLVEKSVRDFLKKCGKAGKKK